VIPLDESDDKLYACFVPPPALLKDKMLIRHDTGKIIKMNGTTDYLLKADVKKIELTKKDAIRKKDENY
jgi:hypothetical protein